MATVDTLRIPLLHTTADHRHCDSLLSSSQPLHGEHYIQLPSSTSFSSRRSSSPFRVPSPASSTSTSTSTSSPRSSTPTPSHHLSQLLTRHTPEDILYTILGYLDAKALSAAAQVNREMCVATSDQNEVWRMHATSDLQVQLANRRALHTSSTPRLDYLHILRHRVLCRAAYRDELIRKSHVRMGMTSDLIWRCRYIHILTEVIVPMMMMILLMISVLGVMWINIVGIIIPFIPLWITWGLIMLSCIGLKHYHKFQHESNHSIFTHYITSHLITQWDFIIHIILWMILFPFILLMIQVDAQGHLMHFTYLSKSLPCLIFLTLHCCYMMYRHRSRHVILSHLIIHIACIAFLVLLALRADGYDIVMVYVMIPLWIVQAGITVYEAHQYLKTHPRHRHPQQHTTYHICGGIVMACIVLFQALWCVRASDFDHHSPSSPPSMSEWPMPALLSPIALAMLLACIICIHHVHHVYHIRMCKFKHQSAHIQTINC